MRAHTHEPQSGAQPRFQSSGVQFLGLSYCTEQNTDGIPSFVHSSLLRNGNHILHQKVGVVRPIFFFWGGADPLPDPQVVAPLIQFTNSQTNSGQNSTSPKLAEVIKQVKVICAEREPFSSVLPVADRPTTSRRRLFLMLI